MNVKGATTSKCTEHKVVFDIIHKVRIALMHSRDIRVHGKTVKAREMPQLHLMISNSIGSQAQIYFIDQCLRAENGLIGSYIMWITLNDLHMMHAQRTRIQKLWVGLWFGYYQQEYFQTCGNLIMVGSSKRSALLT